MFPKERIEAVLFFSVFIITGLTQAVVYQIQPTSSYNLTSASAQACYANCQSCITSTNQCEECFAPYFTKAQDGSCTTNSAYTLQSSSNEILAGNAFIYTTQSWGTVNQTDCQSNSTNFTGGLRILGPFYSNTTITYKRTLSLHSYIVVRFQLIQMNWSLSSILKITIKNQDNVTLASSNVTYFQTVPKEQLCSADAVDQRYSITFQIPDTAATQVLISFIFNSNGSSESWGIATWALITGHCDSTCSNCSFSIDPTLCIGCNDFFIIGSDQICSQCYTGFMLVTTNGNKICQKCPIDYHICSVGQQLCFYNGLVGQVNSSNCDFIKTDKGDYNDTLDINSDLFPGSLLTVSGKPAIYLCDKYSIVGLAQRGDSITRLFANMQQHLTISFTFNIFVVDQYQQLRSNIIGIILDGRLLETTYVNTEAISNLCSNASLQAFVTYPATAFYQHRNTQNINLTITSNATNWGIRNLRVAYQVCDSTCLKCSLGGCIECDGYFQLDSLICFPCPTGFGLHSSNGSSSKNTCIQCARNCISCVFSITNNINTTTCIQCSSAFFVYQGGCRKRTNIGQAVSIPDSVKVLLIGNSSSNSSGGWNTNINSNSTDPYSNETCSINLPSLDNSPSINFTVTENIMTAHLTISQPFYRRIIQFHLIKIDTWDPKDHLDLYVNDLLVMSKNYSSFGNSVCFNPNQTDFLSFESINIQDSNNSVSVSFEVVSASGTTRRFGVSQFKIYPVGCSQCQGYDFSYRFDYSYDRQLQVHLSFNRVYINNNETLFKQIFTLLIDRANISYSITWNNSVTYILQANIKYDVTSGNLSVVCNYPEFVSTDITNQINENPFFTTSRLLQSLDYSHLKIIDNNASAQNLVRFTPIESSSIDGVQKFFQVISRMTIYIGFALFFFGCQTVCTHTMHNLQKIWIHIFVASLSIPSVLKYALTGFREVQGQNIAINPSVWEQSLPRQLYYPTPAYYQQYYTDIGFLRNIYNIAFAFGILCLFSVAMHFIMKHKHRFFKPATASNIFFRHLNVTFYKRPFFVFNSIVFYQYLTLVLACTLQFISLNNQTNQGSIGGLNAAGATFAFILATVYPLIHFLYLRSNFLSSTNIEFTNRYHEIFFRFLPFDIWVDKEVKISYAQRIYSVYRFGQIWWFCILVTGLYESPGAQCFLMMITNFIHMIIVLFTSLNYTIYFKLMKVAELAFFTGVQILILVCSSQIATLTTRSINTLGYVGVALIFAIIFVSFLRSIYTFWKIYQQYKIGQSSHKQHRKVDTRIRNEQHFTSEIEEPVPTENNEAQ